MIINNYCFSIALHTCTNKYNLIAIFFIKEVVKALKAHEQLVSSNSIQTIVEQKLVTLALVINKQMPRVTLMTERNLNHVTKLIKTNRADWPGLLSLLQLSAS